MTIDGLGVTGRWQLEGGFHVILWDIIRSSRGQMDLLQPSTHTTTRSGKNKNLSFLPAAGLSLYIHLSFGTLFRPFFEGVRLMV
jgi:hypothetical protein